MPSLAIITPSFSGDLARCRLLCDSIDEFVVGQWHHYIIVENHEYELFQPLASLRRSIWRMKDLLPSWLKRVLTIPFSNQRSLWFSLKTGWMIGWHIQQIVKIQMAFKTPDEALLYCDSDVFFAKLFDVNLLWTENRLRFFRAVNDEAADVISQPAYLKSAAQILGLGDNPFPCPYYVDNLVVWRASVVRDMCAHIEKSSGKSWIAILGKKFVFSEYSLYGLFVERLSKSKNQLLISHASLCKTEWHKRDMNAAELQNFCDSLEPQQVALGFQSFLGIPIVELRQAFVRAVGKAKSTHRPLE